MKLVRKYNLDLHKSYTLGFGRLETRINTWFFNRVTIEWE
jgi:hypothetical protein